MLDGHLGKWAYLRRRCLDFNFHAPVPTNERRHRPMNRDAKKRRSNPLDLSTPLSASISYTGFLISRAQARAARASAFFAFFARAFSNRSQFTRRVSAYRYTSNRLTVSPRRVPAGRIVIKSPI